MGCLMALTVLGVGYIVLVQANTEKGRLKFLGQLVAVLIMLGAMVSSFYYTSMKCDKRGWYGQGKGMCSMSSKKLMCPIMGKEMAPSDQQ